MRLLSIFILCLISACSNGTADKQRAEQASTPAATRLIISFTDSNTNPEDAQLIQSLASDLEADIKFVRALSGNANLYLCMTKDPNALNDKLNKLGGRDDITYAELDYQRKTQSSKQ